MIEIPLVYMCSYIPVIGMFYIGIVAMRIALNKYCGLCSRHDPVVANYKNRN
jgi:hypothetical protein